MNRRDDYKDDEKWKITCYKQKKKYYDKTAFKYGSKRWTDEEDSIILKHEITDHEISKMIHHSVRAIQVRRSILKSKNEVE